MTREKRKVAAPIGSQQSSGINALRAKPAVYVPIDLKGIFRRPVNRAATAVKTTLALILLAACTPVPDRMDCTDRLRDWREGCTAARDDTAKAAPEAPNPPDVDEPDEPDGDDIEPDSKVDPDGWRDWRDRRDAEMEGGR